MLIYEVNLSVATEVAEAFAAWLPPHITEVLRLGGFQSARWCWRAPEGDEARDRRLWTIHYLVPDEACLQRYFRDHAPALRADGQRRFGSQFTATRRVLHIQQEFSRA